MILLLLLSVMSLRLGSSPSIFIQLSQLSSPAILLRILSQEDSTYTGPGSQNSLLRPSLSVPRRRAKPSLHFLKFSSLPRLQMNGNVGRAPHQRLRGPHGLDDLTPSIVCDLAALISRVARRRDAHNASHVNISFLPSRSKTAEDAIVPATAPFAFHKVR